MASLSPLLFRLYSLRNPVTTAFEKLLTTFEYLENLFRTDLLFADFVIRRVGSRVTALNRFYPNFKLDYLLIECGVSLRR